MRVVDLGVGGVAGRARDLRNDGAFLPGDAVDERGLADIRLADDGNRNAVSLLPREAGKINFCADCVEKVAGAVAVHRRDGDGVAQPQIVELIELGRRIAHPVALVDTEHQRLLALEEH